MASLSCRSVMWKVVILSVAMMAVATLVGATQEENELKVSSGGHGRFLLQQTGVGRRHLLNVKCGDGDGVCKLKGTDVRCCNGVCKDVDHDDDNCGNCNNKCTKNSFGWKCCGGKCVNIMTDPNNCLICGKKCSSGKPCQGGMCGYNSKW
ncbi:hypothetical protein KC19_1G044000 [Ceratodon purpureus]|uniref:Stigma-specific STIG1-like protein 1 n=1 Tax=Ceratodon purpureus TaxID=3225 RepID=A0A8T0J4F3_CERPU|nr:hypothetical protein KC19_1G044000 [Ceratodon purpureus]